MRKRIASGKGKARQWRAFLLGGACCWLAFGLAAGLAFGLAVGLAFGLALTRLVGTDSSAMGACGTAASLP
ncbi:hypothetical protein [Luteibacter rhizovicinus]|uniref:hypothetical protein n=1 Tax=Luteibacter rhizovicinus TaxID=242606 RepID=UPI000F7777A7|nr:hypothetical protein [Luteibacter rhizovicinus]